MMRAGLLRHVVTLKQPTEVNAAGRVTYTYASAGTRRAEIEALNAVEQFDAQRVEGRVMHRITMRHHATLAPHWRIVHGSRTFEVEAVTRGDQRAINTIAHVVEIL